MRSDRNLQDQPDAVERSLDDWEMRSDRNRIVVLDMVSPSLDDWEMRSDRNAIMGGMKVLASLDDWEMRSDRKGRAALDVGAGQEAGPRFTAGIGTDPTRRLRQVGAMDPRSESSAPVTLPVYLRVV